MLESKHINLNDYKCTNCYIDLNQEIHCNGWKKHKNESAKNNKGAVRTMANIQDCVLIVENIE